MGKGSVSCHFPVLPQARVVVSSTQRLSSLPISPDPQTEHLPFHPNTFTCPVLLASLPPSYHLSLPSSYSSFMSQGKHHLLREGDQSLPTSCPHSSTSSPSQPPLIFNYLEVCKWLFAQFQVHCLPTKLCEERDQVFLVHCCMPSTLMEHLNG